MDDTAPERLRIGRDVLLRPDAVPAGVNYFFLYIKRYLEGLYKIRVERGDSRVLTKDLLAKISEQIAAASFLIADTTGNNANVFFESGRAYEKKKPIVFLTQDDPSRYPPIRVHAVPA